jgi:hypothetical protein
MYSSAVAMALLFIAAWAYGGPVHEKGFATRSGARMWEYEEWSIVNPSWTGNAYDLVSTVHFTHTGTGLMRKTEMFYVGSNTWKFRFTGTRSGAWTFRTISLDPELDGYTGQVMVRPNPDSKIKGFLTHVGNRFAIMGWDDRDLQPYVYQVYMNQQDFEQQYNHSSRIWDDPVKRKHLVERYWEDTVDNGFNIYFMAIFYSWFEQGALDRNMLNAAATFTPDPEVFDALEYAIQYAHQRGGRTHIWAWGDQGRRQTPNLLPGGVLGNAHKRLMRYMAARLGPLPGWCMNFGFDTLELPKPEATTSRWANYLNEHMGYRHMLCARGWHKRAFAINSYAGFSGRYELTTTKHGPVGYEEIRDDLESDPLKPHLYEERHTYNRFKYVAPDAGQEPGDGPDQYGMSDGYACWPVKLSNKERSRLNEDGSRRLIWWEQMAGGMGGFFGHFSTRFNSYGPFSQNCGCGYHPESLKRAFRCFKDFWAKDRFRFDMVVDTERVRRGTGYCLRNQDCRHFVFFVENAGSVEINLNGMPGAQPVIAVDVCQEYSEIPMGNLDAGWHAIEFGHASDWAIAIGPFER